MDTHMNLLCDHVYNGKLCDRNCSHKLVASQEFTETYRCGYHWRDFARKNSSSVHYVMDNHNKWTPEHTVDNHRISKQKVVNSTNPTKNTVLMFNAPIYIQHNY